MKKRKGGSGKLIIVFIVLFIAAILAGIGYVYTAPEFEKTAPQIHSSDQVFWNRKSPIKITLSDNRGLKSFKVIMSDGQKSIIVGQGDFEEGKTEQTLLVKYPNKRILDPKAKRLSLHISVTDNSMWNLLAGNSAQKTMQIDVDYKRPDVTIVSHSYSITQGGSALVVFFAEDENLDKLYVEAGGNKFQAQPYKKEGYYAALIAWPFTQTSFSAKVIVTDKAKNTRAVEVPFYLKNYTYKTSWIKARDNFIDGKITDLATNDAEYAGIDNRLEKLKAINETMRLKNEDLIHALGAKISKERFDTWKIQKFYPLRNGQKVASYGDKRYYYYGDKENKVSESYHLGYDLASTKMADIKTSNPGTVVYADYNGIYGNMPMIDHGLGLYTLYGHCSTMNVKKGDTVNAGETIAKTGMTGLALGDHLHFGVLVQGIEVRPVEWFDAKWIKTNIDNIFAEADKIITGK